MAASFYSTQDKFRPVGNPIYFYFDSTLKANEGFKYIVDVFAAGTTNKLAPIKLFPRPDDLLGEIDLSAIFASQVGCFLNQNLHSFSTCATNFYNYDLKLGEEYVKYWSFLINYNNGGSLTLSGNAVTHDFVPGDEVLITFTTPNPTVDGVHIVTSVPSSHAITIDVAFLSGGSTSPFWGTAVYSNKRKTEFTGQTAISGYTAFNGAVGFRDIDSWTSGTYNLVTTGTTYNSKKFLTNVPDGFNIRPENSIWLNFYSTHTINAPVLEVVVDSTTIYFQNPVGGDTTMQTVAVGPLDILHFATSGSCYDFNHNSMSGSLATLFTCNTKEYKVRTIYDLTSASIDSGGTITWGTPDYLPSSEYKTFRYNPSTVGRYVNVELYFMDRLGSVIPWNFEYNSSRQITKNNSQYKQLMGNLSGTKWRTDSIDRGMTQINTTVVEQLTLNTGWLTEAESIYFTELLSSPAVWIKEYGKLWPVIVKTSGLDVLTKNNKRNISQQIIVEYSVNNPIQNF